MVEVERVREVACQAWARFSELRQRLPLQIQVGAGLFAAIMLLVGLYTVLTTRDSLLHLRVQHSFRSGQITVWVDEDSVYSGRLSGVMKKKYVVFGDTLQGSLSQEIPVRSGAHRVRVQITSDEGTVQQDSILADFAKNGERTLLVNTRRGDVALAWQVGESGSESPPASGGGWLNRYATTLIMTIAGSIVSAITGFAIKQLPGYLKSRQTSQ